MRKMLFWEDVRNVCIEYSLYTNGDNKDYSNLAKLVYIKGRDLTDEVLYAIAKDILDHSVTNIDYSYLCYLLNKEVRFIEEKYL